MYVMVDALADGGVYAGIPKEIGLKRIAHTMMVRTRFINIYISCFPLNAYFLILIREQQKWS